LYSEFLVNGIILNEIDTFTWFLVEQQSLFKYFKTLAFVRKMYNDGWYAEFGVQCTLLFNLKVGENLEK